MANAIVTCDMCGAEGERGEQPGEGKIVPCAGETFGGRLPAHGQVCDECADAAQAADNESGPVVRS